MRRALALALILAGCTADRPTPRQAPPPWAPPPPRATTPRPAATRPPPKPAWQARKVVADAVTVPGGRRHIVKPGETGIAIARAYGVPWDRIVAANNLAPPVVLRAGQTLLLPSAAAVAAQSVEDRARAFRVDIDDLITGSEPAGGRAPPPRAAPRPAPA
ncbi:hypothetical protein IP88_10900, partial [alpha proteobacterium AAP81b]